MIVHSLDTHFITMRVNRLAPKILNQKTRSLNPKMVAQRVRLQNQTWLLMIIQTAKQKEQVRVLLKVKELTRMFQILQRYFKNHSTCPSLFRFGTKALLQTKICFKNASKRLAPFLLNLLNKMASTNSSAYYSCLHF